MLELSEDQNNKLKEIVLNYIQGDRLGEIAGRLKTESIEFNTGCKSLFKAVPIEPTDKFIIAILGSLNINREEPGRKFEALFEQSDNEQPKNLHELLTHLYHNGHHHIEYLLKLIEDTNPKRNWTILLMLSALGSAGLGNFFYFNKHYFETISNWFLRTFPFIINWLGKTFSLLRNVPLLGIIYNAIGLLLSWYHTFNNGTKTTTEKLNNLFFKTLMAGLTISAYAISFFAAGTMTVTAAVLFVLSSSIDVFQGVFNWVTSKQAEEDLVLPTAAAWEIVAEYERAKNLHQLAIHSVYVKVGGAILTTIAVGIWSFCPPTLLITIFCVSFMSLTGLTARSILSSMDETAATQLQDAIINIKKKTLPREELCPSNKNRYQEFEEVQKQQDVREHQLLTWHTQLLGEQDQLAIDRANLDKMSKALLKDFQRQQQEFQRQQQEFTSNCAKFFEPPHHTPGSSRSARSPSLPQSSRLPFFQRTNPHAPLSSLVTLEGVSPVASSALVRAADTDEIGLTLMADPTSLH